MSTEAQRDKKNDCRTDETGSPEKLCIRFFRAIFCPFMKLGPIEIFTFILAISTVVQVWAFIQSERAFLTLGAINISNLNTDSAMEISLTIRNGGRSNANGVLHGFVWGGNLPKTPDYIHGPQTIDDLPPMIGGGTVTTNINVAVSQTFKERIRAGVVPFIIYGFIKY